MSNLFSSSIGKKLVMSLSGLFLIVFLLLHMALNMAVFGGAESYNAMCEFMDTNLFIKIMVPVLAAGFALLPFYYVKFTAGRHKKQINTENPKSQLQTNHRDTKSEFGQHVGKHTTCLL